MNNQYKYFGQSLTPNIAQELIQELFAGRTVQRQEIMRIVDETHLDRGGQLSVARYHHPVTLALSNMRRSGLVENVGPGIWSFPSVTKDPEGGETERSGTTELLQIGTLNEFLDWVQQLAPEEYLFRGISNEDHDIEASAYRRLKREENRNLGKFLEINMELIKEARLRGHDQKNGRELSDLELLAELQHFRAATCLIDFTYNAQVALWFACQPSFKSPADSDEPSDGKVVAVRNNPSKFKEITPDLLDREIKIDSFFQGNEDEGSQLYQWQPRQQNYRIIAQQSIFLFGDVKIEADAKCVILEGSKRSILMSLQQVSGITEATLFPDFDGFARLRSHHVPYTQLSASDYTERGSRAHQRNEYDVALADYDVAIQLEPDDAQAYFNRGLVKIELKRYEEALTDFDQAIDLNPNNADAYNNRGGVNTTLENHRAALTDYDEAIRLNPKHLGAYYHRGSLQASLGRIDQAKHDLRTALQLAASVGDATSIVRIGQLLQGIESDTDV